MSKPTAAPNRWPYWDHGTLAQVREEAARAEILDSLGHDQPRRKRA